MSSPPPAASSPTRRGATASRSSGCPLGCPRAPRSATCSASPRSSPRWPRRHPAIRTEIDAAASHLESRADAIGARAKELADQLGDAVPVVYGAGLTTPVAYRWKTQVNENGKLPAFSSPLPEASHNEIAGWGGAQGRFACVLLTDVDQHPRERRRFEVTAELIEPHAAAVVGVEAEGETRTARILELVMLGDLLSLHLAARHGVDPTPIEAIDGLKQRLGDPG